MPRYNVFHNGLWACFTSISDGWITTFMPEADYRLWREVEYGNTRLDLRYANKMTIEEAALSIVLNRTKEAALETMFESGLDEDECAALIDWAWGEKLMHESEEPK